MIRNYETKVEALKRLVLEALAERRGPYPSTHRTPLAPEFDPSGYQTYHQEALVEALRLTDALEVLHVALTGEER